MYIRLVVPDLKASIYVAFGEDKPKDISRSMLKAINLALRWRPDRKKMFFEMSPDAECEFMASASKNFFVWGINDDGLAKFYNTTICSVSDPVVMREDEGADEMLASIREISRRPLVAAPRRM